MQRNEHMMLLLMVFLPSQETDNSVRLKIASLLGLLSKTQGFSPDCIVDDAISALNNESKTHSHNLSFDILLHIVTTVLFDLLDITVIFLFFTEPCPHLFKL